MKMDYKRVRVTSSTGFDDSIELRKALREFESGDEASFLPAIGAWPQTRPGYSPAQVADLAVHPEFRRNVALLFYLYYPDNVDISPASYGIRRESKIGLPYNDRSDKAHRDFMDYFLNTKFDTAFAGHYLFGTRIQTDSKKVRFTGYVQLKAVGDGFQAQRHRMINCGPAINHLLAVYEFDYHHNWIKKYAATCNVVVDKFRDTGYAFAIDYKNYERSLGWDIVFEEAAKRLRQLKRYHHADLIEMMNMHNHVYFQPTFKNRRDFENYMRCAHDKSWYMNYIHDLYNTSFHADDLVEATMKEMRERESLMREMFDAELACPVDKTTGLRVWTNEQVQNSSGVATTATFGKIYSLADTMCRLTELFNIKWTLPFLVDFLCHKFWFRTSNLGDDNLFFSDKAMTVNDFIKPKTGVKVEVEDPPGFLSRLLVGNSGPTYYKNGWLMHRSKSFFRKMSRERDVYKYKFPSVGWDDSYNYAMGNDVFKKHVKEILATFKRLYMGLDEIIRDLKTNVDESQVNLTKEYISYVDNPGYLYRDNVSDPVGLVPEMFYAIDPATRQKIETLNGC